MTGKPLNGLNGHLDGSGWSVEEGEKREKVEKREEVEIREEVEKREENQAGGQALSGKCLEMGVK